MAEDPEWADFHKIGTAIDDSLYKYYVELIRLSLLEDILPENNIETFYEMFDRLLKKTASPFETASIIYSVLEQCSCKDGKIFKLLQPYLIADFDLRRYPNILLKLRIAEFLCNLGEENCLLAMMVYSYLHMDNMAIDRYSPLQFIHILFQRNVAEIDKLNELAGWFNKKDYFQNPSEGICHYNLYYKYFLFHAGMSCGMYRMESVPNKGIYLS